MYKPLMSISDYGMFVPKRIDTEWAYWIRERENIRIKKAAHLPPPWTASKVMAETRWCCARRMDDKVSIWLLENWFLPDGYASNRTAVVAGLLARMINKPETLTEITGGKRFTKWDKQRAYDAMYKVKASGQPVFTGAFIINGASGGPKIDQVLNAIDDAYQQADSRASQFVVPESMQATAAKLSGLRGVGSFISGQVVADLRHVLGDVKAGWWGDRMTWAPPGPGSSRGMRYLLGASAQETVGRGTDLKEKQFLPALRKLVELAQRHPVVAPVFKERKLEAHDIQNTLCETSKFVRISYGLGKAKNNYDPQAGHARMSGHDQMDLSI